MFGYNLAFDISFLIVASLVTIYLQLKENPFEKGTNENKSLRLCRIGLAFLIWSLGFWGFGFVFSVVALILGIIGMVKGRTQYGRILTIGSLVSFVSRFVIFEAFFKNG